MSKRINPYKLFVGSFLPNWLLKRAELTAGAKLCYARLCQYAGERGFAWPKQEELAKEVGFSIRCIKIYLKELKEFGLIQIEQQGLKKPNIYHFLWHEWMEPSTSGSAKSALLEGTDSILLEGTDSYLPYKELKESDKDNQELPPIPPKGDDGFEEFWNDYPRKTAKVVARQRWEKLKPDYELRAKIMEGLGRAKDSPQWQRDNGQYIPHPATWLNQRRWEDEEVKGDSWDDWLKNQGDEDE